ncbi:MAG: immunity 50 family protein [Sedimenticola sp.]|nr:immunity 50 family protein [Sedimenticola sp.]
MIKDRGKVVNHFGYWPEFADGKFTRFSYENIGLIEASIIYIDSNTSKVARIALKFNGVTDIQLSELKSENVIDEMSFIGESPTTVVIKACYGLNGSFMCTEIEVCSVHT